MVDLAYRSFGDPDADPMILLHGAGSPGYAWDAVAADLSDTWRLYVPDLRGYGASPRPGAYSFELMRDDVLGLMDSLGLDSAVIVGHSMGAMVGYLLAAKEPQRVAALVLEEPPPPIPLGLRLPPRPNEPLDYDWDLRPMMVAQLNDPDPAWVKAAEAITAPALVLAGGPTSGLPQDRIAELADRLPGGRLVTIPAGHAIHNERPVEFCAAIRDFLISR